MGWISRKISDLSGKEGKDDDFTNVVVRTHPHLEESIQFDALPSELKGLVGLEDLVQLELRRGEEVVELVVSLEEFNKLAPNMEEVLANADTLRGRRRGYKPAKSAE